MTHYLNNKTLLTILSFFIFTNVNAQDTTKIEKFLNNESVVYNIKKENVEIKVNKNTLEISSNILLEKQNINKTLDSWADEYLFSDKFVEIYDIDAQLYVPKNGKYISSKPLSITEQENYFGSVFYDDSKIKKITFQKAPLNSKTKINYKEFYNNPSSFGHFFFGGFFPVLYSEFSVTFPEEVKVDYMLYNAENYNVIFSENKKKQFITYKWSIVNLKSFKSNQDDFPLNYFEPHIILNARLINKDNENNSISNLYKSYINLLKNPYPPIDPIFKTIVDSICTNATCDSEKLDLLYGFVQSKINYVAIEDGYNGFIPETPLKVYTQRYGDCKGKANLLVTLLRQAKIDAWLSWVGTRKKPYKYTDFASIYNDDHMIVVARINDCDYFLDPTELFLHYSFPSEFIQGKQTMMGLDSINFRILEIPVVDNSKNIFFDNLSLNIQNDTLIGNGFAEFLGYYKNNLTVDLIRHSEEKNQETYRKWLFKSLDKAKINNIQSVNLSNKLDTLRVNYKIEIPAYVKYYEDLLFINLNFDKKYKNSFIDSSEINYGKYLNYAYTEKLKYNLNIPKGYDISIIPQNINIEFDEFFYKINYYVFPRNIEMIATVVVKNPYVKRAKFIEWNLMIGEINKAYNQTIVLKKINSKN